MTSTGKNFILLVKKVGKRKDKSGSSSVGLNRSKVKTDVLPGTLLHHVDTKIKGPSFYLVLITSDSDPVAIDCIPGEAEEISMGILDLLQPVATCSERITVYNDKKWLTEGKQLQVNDSVFVKMRIDLSELPGVIKYKGMVPDMKGIYFGVELIDHPGKGTSNGKFRRYQFFQCADDGAVFCALNKIRRRKESFQQSELSKAEGSQYKAKQIPDMKYPGCNLVIGDRIVWMKDKGQEYGTVKWIGVLPDARFREITVGVEFDQPVGSGTGKYKEQRLFYAKQNHASLIPVMGLLKADEFSSGRNGDINKDSGMYTDTTSQLHQESCGYGSSRQPTEHVDTDYTRSYTNSTFPSSKDDDSVIKKEKEKLGYFDQSLIEIPNLPAKVYPSEPQNLGNTLTYKGDSSDIDKEFPNGKTKLISKSRLCEDKFNDSGNYLSKGMNPVYEYHRQEVEENENMTSRSRRIVDTDLSVGWRVMIPLKQSTIYGVIRWIGLYEGKETVGIETDEESPSGTDGTFKGERLFECAPNHAFFAPLDKCKKDRRFYTSIRNHVANGFGSLETPDISGDVSPPESLNTDNLIDRVCGKNRGIQGHHNSCYLDSMLFGMFYFTTVFDTILYQPPREDDIEPYETVQQVLKEGIVNPLRRNHYVRADKVMKLRELLDKHSSIPGMMNEEKDPEEFLLALLADVMKEEPFLHLSSGEHTYFYQLFMERDDLLLLPTTQRLLEISCLQGNVKLKEVPSCLIIQMPRFGKDYKMYRRIIPSLELDITDILENSPRECMICGRLAGLECKECYHVTGSPGLNSISFCVSCGERNHQHPSRKSHVVTSITIPDEYLDFLAQNAKHNTKDEPEYAVPRDKMELFAVICIQTSHYVSFVKCGSGRDAPWVFFDSMADRIGEQSGYNIPQVTPVPDLKNWLSEAKFEELATVSDDKLFPEHMRRLLGDAYMCMYQSPDVMRFR